LALVIDTFKPRGPRGGAGNVHLAKGQSCSCSLFCFSVDGLLEKGNGAWFEERQASFVDYRSGWTRVCPAQAALIIQGNPKADFLE